MKKNDVYLLASFQIKTSPDSFYNHNDNNNVKLYYNHFVCSSAFYLAALLSNIRIILIVIHKNTVNS